MENPVVVSLATPPGFRPSCSGEKAVRSRLFDLVNTPPNGDTGRDLESYILSHFSIVFSEILSEEHRGDVQFEMSQRVSLDDLKRDYPTPILVFKKRKSGEEVVEVVPEWSALATHGYDYHISHVGCKRCWASAVASVVLDIFRRPGAEEVEEGLTM